MVKIYSDSALLIPINSSILFEGINYFLDSQYFNVKAIEDWIAEEYILASLVSYHPQNPIIQIRFENVVGFVNILGAKFDVRSSKLFDNIEGNLQFQSLLDDINNISKKLTFNVKGTSKANRINEFEYSTNILETFDYFYQLTFTFPKNVNLDALYNQCFFHPKSTNVTRSYSVDIAKSKTINHNFFKQFGKKMTDFGVISETHSLANSTLSKKTFNRIGKRLYPTKVENNQLFPDLDTIENKFIKFILNEILRTCLIVQNSTTDIELNSKASKLYNHIQILLFNPFFKNISRLYYFPNSSTVLLRQAGYKELYHHYIQSKFSFRPLLSDIQNQALSSGLKNIATLYEIWAFFKVAFILFKKDTILETYNGKVLKNGSLLNSYSWEGRGFELGFNCTYSRLKTNSYSVSFRPDISLKIEDGKLFLFDAKYKFKSQDSQEDDELLRIVKPEDLNKMHAYVDALSAQCAFVVYPGSTFVFYDRNTGIQNTAKSILNLLGVGATPLLPNFGDNYLEDLLTF